MVKMFSLFLAAAMAACAALGYSALADGEVDQWKEARMEDPFPIGALRPQSGWVADPVAAGEWKPADQPNLAEELAAAPALQVVDVAPAPQRCWVGNQPYLVPNPDGSWDMLWPYFNRYGGRQEVIIHDFGTGETTRQILSTREGDSVLTRDSIDFHMQPAYYADGKMIFEIGGVIIFVVYDPAENKFVHGAKPFGNEVIQGRAVLGEDGLIYGMGWQRGGDGFVAYSFDPKTYEAKRFPTFGPANRNRRELYRSVTMSGDWIYAGIGANPWHLVAFNVRTEEGRLLATHEGTGSYMTVGLNLVKGGVTGHIQSPSYVNGIDIKDIQPEEFRGIQRFNFWLHDGNIIKREGNIPPWSNQPAEPENRRLRWDRGAASWRGIQTATAPPEIRDESGDPAPGGHVAMQYRLPGEDWKTLEYDVTMYPGLVRRLVELNANMLFAVDEGYGEHVFYNMETGALRRIGGTVSPYAIGLSNDRLYVAGYPSSQIYEYDFTRPLGLMQEVPNPRMVALTGRHNDTHVPLDNVVALSDGRLYISGHNVEVRSRAGGGYGWYDPATGEMGGAPIDDYRFFWNTGASDGRYFLMSCKHPQKPGELFCYDSQAKEIIYQKPILDGAHPGPIVEAMPGLVIGHQPAGDGKGILYGLRPETGEVLWTKEVPAGPVTSISECRRHAYSFRRGPDGHIWTFFGDTLVRIDPRNANVVPVGKVGSAAQLAFAGGKLYIAGAGVLRRIEGVQTPVW